MNHKTAPVEPVAPPDPKVQWQFAGIGTSWWVGIYDVVPADRRMELQTAVAELVEQFDVHYSRFRPDSLVSIWARSAGTYPLPDDGFPLLQTYKKLYDATNGAVTPLVGQLLSDAGYDASYSLVPGPTRRPPRWEDVLECNETTITLHKPALLDFGAAGKGYLVDLICNLLAEQGIRNFCVDGSGDMRCVFTDEQPAPLAIGLEHPSSDGQVIGVAHLGSGALCGSAGNRRVWGNAKQRYTHIMSPFSRTSPTHLQAVWVTAADTMTADGLATALYFSEPAKLAQAFDFEYAVILADGSLQASRGFRADFFVQATA